MKRTLIICLLSICLLPHLNAQRDTIQNLQLLPSDDPWWQMFGDATLTLLIDKSVANNYNLQNAIKNIEIARTRMRLQQAGFFPSITASAQYSPEKSSLGINQADMYRHVGQAQLEMNWELDVFGSIRKNVQAQKEYYLASREDYRGVMVSLAAQVATAYFQLRTYQQQLEVAKQNVKSQEEILQINETKLNVGLGSSLAVAQSKSLLLQTRATIPGIQASIYSQANTLTVLTGEYSDSLRRVLLQPDSLPVITGIFMEGIPAELVRRRPDIRSAERTMDALASAAGATRADWWPKFYITGAFGFGNDYFKHFFREENMTWQISPSIKWTIFSGRQVAENNRLARLQLDEGINNFNQTMLTALQEIDDAIYTYNQSVLQLEADRQAMEQTRLTLQYAVDLYQKGLADYQSVLDSQRSVFEYEITLVNAESATLINLIQLYRAIGSGTEQSEASLRMKNEK